MGHLLTLGEQVLQQTRCLHGKNKELTSSSIQILQMDPERIASRSISSCRIRCCSSSLPSCEEFCDFFHSADALVSSRLGSPEANGDRLLVRGSEGVACAWYCMGLADAAGATLGLLVGVSRVVVCGWEALMSLEPRLVTFECFASTGFSVGLLSWLN